MFFKEHPQRRRRRSPVRSREEKTVKSMLFVVALLCALVASAHPADTSAGSFGTQTLDSAMVLELADDIFAAARARNAQRFANFFADDPQFVYLINTRQLGSRREVESTFASMLSRQTSFDPQWGNRAVRMLTPAIGLLTGEFTTTARRVNGEEWRRSGAVTFVAVRTIDGWRVVNWHTSE
jgi:uncharacterized protein (TIGR02246 family)